MALLEKTARGMKKRTLVRIMCYVFVSFVAVTGFCIKGFSLAKKYETQLEYTYQRGVSELSEHMDSINTALIKGMYSGTAKGFSEYSMNLWSEASAAKTALSQIPSTSNELDKTYEFLSQVGNYALSLSDKVADGGILSDDERATLSELTRYSGEMKQAVADMVDEINTTNAWTIELKNAVEQNGNEDPSALYEGLKGIEESLTDYPTLLYDGPFSSHILQSEAQLLKNKEETGRDDARSVAEKMCGNQLYYSHDENGAIPCYVFNGDTTVAAVTKQGGYCSYFINSREIGEQTLSPEEALERAREYMSGLSLGDFKDSYYEVSEGICVVNFAYFENPVVYYTDLIKVGIALDNGEAVMFGAQGFIMNHTDRGVRNAKMTAEKAESVLSPLLKVKSCSLAVVPLNSRAERLCYEFLCDGENGDQLLVYINADTLSQEDIKLLVKTDSGTLTL